MWFVLVVLGCLLPAHAQTSGGSIAGSVLDATGALIPGASVTATGADTGTVYHTVTTSSGTFHFPQMQLGRYDLTVSASGFRAQQLTGILVTTGNVSPAEVHLSAGGAGETGR